MRLEVEWVVHGREIDKKHDKDCCEERGRLAKVILNGNGEWRNESTGVGALVLSFEAKSWN